MTVAMGVVGETLSLLQDAARHAPLPRVRALHLPPVPPPGGLRGEFCAVELEDGALGLSYVLLGNTWAQLTARFTAPSTAPPAARVSCGDDALALAQGYASADTLTRTVGFAAVNAITRHVFDRAGFVPPTAGDSLGQLDLQPGETLGMIGHFTPLLPRVRALGARVIVLELRADLVAETDGVRVTLDPSELRGCDKILATGTLLLNHSLARTLQAIGPTRHFVMVGPSVGGPPDPLFSRGVSLLGGSWVQDPTAFVAALNAGKPPGGSLRKFALTPANWPGWSSLLASRGP